MGVITEIDGIDAFFEGEVQFVPSFSLDNGLTIGANAELELRAGAGGTADTIDEAYVFIEGNFGRVEIGDTDSAGRRMHVTSPVAGVFAPSSRETGFQYSNLVPVSGFVGGVGRGGDFFRGTLGETAIENERNNDAGRIAYYSPDFGGFSAGISYARDATQNTLGGINTAFAAAANIIDIAFRYDGRVGNGDLAASLRYGFAEDNRTPVAGTDIGSNPTVVGVGVSYDTGMFAVGAAYAMQSKAGIYIIRNPLDVVPSLAKFYIVSIDEAVALLNSPSFVVHGSDKSCVQFIGSWSVHVDTWTDRPRFPLCMVRYEDLHSDPHAAFTRILEIMGVPLDPERLDRAIRFSSFKTLRAQEDVEGFIENSGQDDAFFREGKTGTGKAILTDAQIDMIVESNRPMMERFGYLP